jgi:hypothetical protein
MKSVEKIIYYMEYGINLLKWGITSLRSFPSISEKGKGDNGNASGRTTTE